ncbi:MAG: SDR family oxidoreductase [Solirubrobacterales bacterium]|nr:SDR family oxidoreductase [Solirubrobacterales bacterium]
MRVFITGGTGLVGSAVTAELLSHGHSVLALVRSDKSANAVQQAGAEPVRGSLSDLDVIRTASKQADGVIHLAFSNDFSSAEALASAVAEETAALKAIAQQLTNTNRPLVTVSGTPWVPDRTATESDPVPTEGPVGGRGKTVTEILGLANLRASAVRLPRTVHNQGQGGFAGLLTNIARSNGVSGYPGDGEQRWPAVHALDAAVLFRLALERAEPGTAWHAVDDEGDKVKDIAAVIGRRLGVEVKSVPAESFGPLGQIFGLDQPASSQHTRQALGWEPTHPKLLKDLELIQP